MIASPTPIQQISDDEMIVSATDYFVTESVLNARASADEVAQFLKRMRTTGQITLTTHSGGVRKVVVVERTELTDKSAEVMRRSLGMSLK